MPSEESVKNGLGINEEELSKVIDKEGDIVWGPEDGIQVTEEPLTTPEPRPEQPIFSPAPSEDYDKELADKASAHQAIRNIRNISKKHGVNRPVIAGVGPRQRNVPQAPTQTLKSIPGNRTGVFIPNPNKITNNSTKISHT